MSQSPGLDTLQPQAQGRPEGHKPGASFRLCNFDLGALARASDRPSQVALEVKNLPANAGDRRDMGSIPGYPEDPLEEGMATYSSIFAWRTPWTEEPGGPQSDTTEATQHGTTGPLARSG